jgi:hypothetical protein
MDPMGTLPRRARRLFGVVTAIAAMAAAPGLVPGARADDPQTLAAKWSKSIFRVDTFTCYGFEDSGGTAFVVGPRTLITNAHVIGRSDPNRIQLTDRDGRTILGRLESWASGDTDLARITVETDLPPALTFADPAGLSEGQPVTVIGYPKSRFSVTSGLLNSFTVVDGKRVSGLTDAVIDRGNSGSPALTADGQVIGVLNAVETSGISRPGRFLTSATVEAGFATPDPVNQQWCDAAPAVPDGARATLRPVSGSGYRMRVPTGLLDRSDLDSDGDRYWTSATYEFYVVAYRIETDETVAERAAGLQKFYAVDGVSVESLRTNALVIDGQFRLRNGTTQRIVERTKGSTTVRLAITYSRSAAADRLVNQIVASFTPVTTTVRR